MNVKTLKKYKWFWLAIALTICTVVLIAWLFKINSNVYIYGQRFDEHRSERSIPILGSKSYTDIDWGSSWAYPIDGKGHRWKHVNVFKGELTYESDTYYSDIKFKNEAGRHGNEHVVITYSYKKEKAAKAPWSAKYYFKNGFKNITLEEAEIILESWNIERLSSGSNGDRPR